MSIYIEIYNNKTRKEKSFISLSQAAKYVGCTIKSLRYALDVDASEFEKQHDMTCNWSSVRHDKLTY